MFEVYKHLTKPESARDETWETEFLENLKDIKVNVIQQDPVVGPDNWPYMFLQSDENGQDYLLNVFKWCSDKGVGIALNPHKELPDYIFTYGMVWSYINFSTLFPPLEVGNPGQKVFEEKSSIVAGPPSEEYLPKSVRAVLAEFFKQQEIEDMKVLVVSEDQKEYDLCFSLDSLDNPPKEEHKDLCEAIAWFLPYNYSIMLIQEEGLPPFYSL